MQYVQCAQDQVQLKTSEQIDLVVEIRTKEERFTK